MALKDIVKKDGSLDKELLVAKYLRADSERSRFSPLFSEAYEYFLPGRRGRGSYRIGPSPILYDSTAMHALREAAARLKAAVFPSGQEWMSFKPGPALIEEGADMGLLEDVFARATEKWFIALRRTNFEPMITESLLDFVIGTSVIKITPGLMGDLLRFEAISPDAVAIEHNPHGAPLNVFYSRTFQKQYILHAWKNAKLPESISSKQDHEECEVIECSLWDGTNYRYVVFEPSDGDQLLNLVLKRPSMIVARHTVASGESYGRGPALTAVPSAKTTNGLVGHYTQMAAFASNPLLEVVGSNVVLPPGTAIRPGMVLRLNNEGVGVREVPIRGSFNPTEIGLESIREQMRRVIGGANTPPSSASARSASEIEQRQEALQRADSETYGRIESELFRPLVENITIAFQQAGILPKNGFDVRNPNNIQVIVEAPLARNERLREVDKILQFMELETQTGQRELHRGRSMKHVGNELGIAQDLRMTNDEREASQEEAEQQLEAIQAAQSPQAATG